MYYDIHIFHNRKNSFSIPFESNSIDELEIIKDAVTGGFLSRFDADAVDYVEIITYDEYKAMKNI